MKRNQKYFVPILLILLFISLENISQNRWLKIYYGEKDAVGNNFINSYDKGFLLVGKHGSNSVNYNWLIKTDINGEILWEKTLGDPSTNIMISDMAYNQFGDLYLVGLTGYYNNADYDPMIMKLNACGEKQWCKVFIEDGINFSNTVVVLPDGSCVNILRYMGTDLQTDRICLAKFSIDGEMIWKHCYNSQDSSIYNEDAYDLTITIDGGYLITGDCDYIDPNPPHYWWGKPYYIKTDSLGVFEWETVVHKEISDIGGSAFFTVLNPDSNIYYSSIRHFYHTPYEIAPALLKMDMMGNVIDIYDIVNGYENGKLSYATFINDATLAASAGWGTSGIDLWTRAVIIDTVGNLLNSLVLMQDSYTSILQVTYDGKLAYMTNTDANGQFDIYLRKLNQNLEDDTLYNQPFTYDSLCPYSIVSDTIVQDDCDLIVGVKEVKPEPIIKNGLKIFPNPSSTTLTISYNTEKYEKPEEIIIFNTFGILVKKIRIPDRKNQHTIDISSFPSGLYIAVLRNERKIIAKGKFIIAR